MKRNISRLLLTVLILMLFTGAVFANDYQGKDGWAVTYNGKELKTNFTSAEIVDTVSVMQPGDTVTFSVSIQNAGGKDADFWMSNKVIESFEDAGKASDGAYAYELVYSGASGENVLYSSDTVGGEDKTGGEGLHKATGALENYFFLETLKNGQKGKVTVKVALDGETQGNAYQDAVAKLKLDFAVEDVKEGKPPIKTGDTNNLLPYYLVALGAGAALLILVLFRMKKTAKEDGSNE